MFDWVDDALDAIKELFNDLLNTLVDLASGALTDLGIADLWNDLLQTDVINSLLTYAPLADKLIQWHVVTIIFTAEFAILISLVTFKVIVKLIPTVW